MVKARGGRFKNDKTTTLRGMRLPTKDKRHQNGFSQNSDYYSTPAKLIKIINEPHLHTLGVREGKRKQSTTHFTQSGQVFCVMSGKANWKPAGKDLMGLRRSCTEDPLRQVFICLSVLEGKGLAQGQTL